MVALDQLQKLLPMLEQLIQPGLSVDLLSISAVEETENKSVSAETMSKILTSLEAALIYLKLATAPTPKQFFIDEFVTSVIQLIKHQMLKSLLPIYDPTFRFSSGSVPVSDPKDEGADIDDSGRKKKRKTISAGSSLDFWKQRSVDKDTKTLLHKLCDLLDSVHELLLKEPFQDSWLLQLSTVTMPCFFVEGKEITLVQLCAMNVMRAMFCRYEQHRQVILEDMISSLIKLPSSKRAIRTYKISPSSSVHIQMTSALLLQLLQSCTFVGDLDKKEDIPLESAVGSTQSPSISGNSRAPLASYEAAVFCAKTFVTSVLNKCQPNKASESDYRVLVEHLLEDVLTLLYHPEWPAAECLLHILSVSLANVLTVSEKDKGFDTSLKGFAIDVLGTIASRLKKDLRLVEDRPIALPKPKEQVNMHAQPDAEGEDSQCVCGKGYGQRFMLDCDTCHRWFHGECVGVTPDSPPSVWYCDECQIRTALERQRKLRLAAAAKAAQEEELMKLQQPTTTQTSVLLAELDEVVDITKSARSKTGKKQKASEKEERTPRRKNAKNGDQEDRDKTPRSRKKRKTVVVIEDDHPQEPLVDAMELEAPQQQHLTAPAQTGKSMHDSAAVKPSPSASRGALGDDAEVEVRIEDANFEQLANDAIKAEEEEEEVFQQLVLNYLAEKCRVDSSIIYARQFLIQQWIWQSKGNSAMVAFFKSQIPLPPKSLHVTLPSLSTEGTFRICRQLTVRWTLNASFKQLQTHILNQLNENQATLRAKALKSLASVVEADPLALGEVVVQSAVRGRFLDQSISVREAAVDLVGKFVLYRPEFALQYHEMILERILDKGTSVRKRVVKILRDIALQQPDHPRMTEICIALVKRVNDTEGVKELVMKTFQQLWFSSFESKEDVKRRSRQIAQMVEKVPTNDWLVSLLAEILSSKEKEKKEQETAQYQSICSQLCTSWIEQFIELPLNDQLPIMKTLRMFCEASAALLSNHCMTLLPYVKADQNTKEESILIQHVCGILEKTLPLLQRPNADRFKETESDLCSLVVKQGTTVLHSAVKCLSVLVHHVTHRTAPLESLLNKFLTYLEQFLKKWITSEPIPANHKPNVFRSLFALGLLCRYHDFDDSSNQTSTVDRLFQIYRKLLVVKDTEVRKRALQGLGFLLIRAPRLLLECDAIFPSIFDSSAPSQLRCQLVLSFSELLEDMYNKMQCNTPTENPTASNNTQAAEEATDVGIVTGIMQQYLEHLLELTMDVDLELRTNALNTVRLLLVQGLVNPIQCVAQLIALQSDPSSLIRDVSLRALTSVFEKHPEFLLQRLTDGLYLAFELQMKLHQSVTSVIDSTTNECVLSRIYMLIRPNRVSRNRVLNQLVNLLDVRVNKRSSYEYLKFVAEVISLCPFTVQEEPLQIVYSINRMLHLQAANLEAYYQSDSSIVDGNQRVIEASPRSGDSTPSKSLLTPMDEHSFSQSAFALCVALLLKRNLKYLYQLNDAKCQSFIPGEATKATEKAIGRTVDLVYPPIDWSSLNDWTKCDIHGRYEILKAQLEADSLDLSLHTPVNRRIKKRVSSDSSVARRIAFDPDGEPISTESPANPRNARKTKPRRSSAAMKKSKTTVKKKRKKPTRVVRSDTEGEESAQSSEWEEPRG
eukprot:GILJ01011719.1.p1 GENE.GILJ01011719.1~~GILJ01011719.1.p1  ORF type:complete len:1804 (-),score=314.35 GILJ01011719.1:286-5187(-)